jgi:hypothetical protein
MSNVAATSGAGAAAAAAAAIAQATRASGAIIKMEPAEFVKMLHKSERPLVAYAVGGFWGKSYSYLTSYKGLFFYCKNREPLALPGAVETITCEKIWIPGN